MLDYKVMADNDSMYNTPPCYCIYVAKLVYEWILSLGGLKKMKELNVPKLFRKTGTELTAGLKAAGAAHGFDLVVSGEPALFYLRIANDDSLMLHQEWVAECVSRGLFITSHHNHFINAAITGEEIALAVDIADDAFSVVAARHPELDLKP